MIPVREIYPTFPWEPEEGEGGGVLIVMNGRSRMAIDPLIPTMPGRSTSGLHCQADVAYTDREAL